MFDTDRARPTCAGAPGLCGGWRSAPETEQCCQCPCTDVMPHRQNSDPEVSPPHPVVFLHRLGPRKARVEGTTLGMSLFELNYNTPCKCGPLQSSHHATKAPAKNNPTRAKKVRPDENAANNAAKNRGKNLKMRPKHKPLFCHYFLFFSMLFV